ncbi:MAG: 50S ribosomal protein L11 methyltransferase [Desulfurococcales archaeon]
MDDGRVGEKCPEGAKEELRWSYKICIPPSVYDPSDDTYLILDYLERNGHLVKGASVLDIGTGSGIISLLSSQLGAKRVISIDISQQACEATSYNAKKVLNEKSDVIDVIMSDGVRAIRKGSHFDLVLMNPPYLPEGEKTGDLSLDRALEGGATGAEVSISLLTGISETLSGSYTLLLVASSLGNAEKVMNAMRSLSYIVSIESERKYFFETLYLIKGEKVE